MQEQPYDTQLALWADNPVVCVHCGQVVAELPELDLAVKLRDHLCGDQARWCA